jgi:hypothetical protein
MIVVMKCLDVSVAMAYGVADKGRSKVLYTLMVECVYKDRFSLQRVMKQGVGDNVDLLFSDATRKILTVTVNVLV